MIGEEGIASCEIYTSLKDAIIDLPEEDVS